MIAAEAVTAAVAACCAAGWIRERRRHNASIRMFARALAGVTGDAAELVIKAILATRANVVEK